MLRGDVYYGEPFAGDSMRCIKLSIHEQAFRQIVPYLFITDRAIPLIK